MFPIASHFLNLFLHLHNLKLNSLIQFWSNLANSSILSRLWRLSGQYSLIALSSPTLIMFDALNNAHQSIELIFSPTSNIFLLKRKKGETSMYWNWPQASHNWQLPKSIRRFAYWPNTLAGGLASGWKEDISVCLRLISKSPKAPEDPKI